MNILIEFYEVSLAFDGDSRMDTCKVFKIDREYIKIRSCSSNFFNKFSMTKN